MIQLWKPWEKSTGPKSEEGKRKSAKRGYKGAQREEMREIAKALRAQRDCIDQIETQDIQ